jgi:hypothetical protein
MGLMHYFLVPLAAVAASVGVVAAAPPAVADCTTNNGSTLCSQGDVRGPNNGNSLSGVPYGCADPYGVNWGYGGCNGWGLEVDLDNNRPLPPPGPGPGPRPPGRPGIGPRGR